MGLKDTLIHIGGVLGLATYGDESQGYQPQQQQPMDGYSPMQEQPPQEAYYPQDGQNGYPPPQQTTQYQPQQGQNPYGYGGQQPSPQQQQQKGGGFQQGYQPPRQPRNARQQQQQTQVYQPQQEPYQTQAYGNQPGYGNAPPQQQPRAQEQAAPPPQQQKRQSHQILIVHVRSVEDAQQYIQALLGGYTVLLNLDGADQHVAQRVIDQLTGATFALGGTLAPVTPYVFVLTSSDTKITDSERARAREYPPQQRRR